jgi:four helix bundle protein
MAVTTYRDLIAWQKAMDLVADIYRVTQKFPREEQYGLTNQLRRAAVSIPSNIAEGQGRGTPGDLLRGLAISNGSRQEAETQILIADRLGFIDTSDRDAVIANIDELGRIMTGLTKSIR